MKKRKTRKKLTERELALRKMHRDENKRTAELRARLLKESPWMQSGWRGWWPKLKHKFEYTKLGVWLRTVTTPYRKGRTRYDADLALLLMLVNENSSLEHKRILYQKIMDSESVTHFFKLRYWFRNKILYRSKMGIYCALGTLIITFRDKQRVVVDSKRGL